MDSFNRCHRMYSLIFNGLGAILKFEERLKQ